MLVERKGEKKHGTYDIYYGIMNKYHTEKSRSMNFQQWSTKQKFRQLTFFGILTNIPDSMKKEQKIMRLGKAEM